jgi:O-antigen/teichoic acid export membrane protein
MEFKKALATTIIWKTLNTLFTFCINLLIVRLLGADKSGNFFYAIAVLSFLTLLIGLCLENGITYYTNANKERLGNMLIFIFGLLFFQGIISWVVLYFFTFPFSSWLAWILIVSYLSINYFSALFTAKKWFTAANGIVAIVNFVVVILFWIVYNGGTLPFAPDINTVPKLFVGGVFLQALLLMVYFFLFAGKTKSRIGGTVTMYTGIFRFSLIVFLSNLILFLVMRTDYYFTERYCSSIELSNYLQVSKLGQMLLLLPSMAAGVIFPYTSSGDSKTMAGKTIRVCRLLLLVNLSGAVAITAFGYWLFPWLFGEKFNQMYIPMLLLLPGILCLSLLTVISAFLDGIKKIWLAVAGNIAALAFIIVADYLLIPMFGIKAAAATSSVGYFICTAVSYYWFAKYSGTSMREFFNWNKEDLFFLRK